MDSLEREIALRAGAVRPAVRAQRASGDQQRRVRVILLAEQNIPFRRHDHGDQRSEIALEVVVVLVEAIDVFAPGRSAGNAHVAVLQVGVAGSHFRGRARR